jgi:hypothetical protein
MTIESGRGLETDSGTGIKCGSMGAATSGSAIRGDGGITAGSAYSSSTIGSGSSTGTELA